MGKLVVTRRWVEDRRLELTDEDWAIREERDKRRRPYTAKPLHYMLAFTRHLEPCPYCGNAPRIRSLWNDKSGFYSIKLGCCLESTLDCGDWYKQLSRAGLDWNYRVRHQLGEPLKSVPHYYPKRKAGINNDEAKQGLLPARPTDVQREEVKWE